MRKLTAILLLSLLFTACADSSVDKDFTDGKVSFQTTENVPIVKGTLNGKEAYYIIDSGASLSVLDESQSKDYRFNSFKAETVAHGYGGSTTLNNVSNAAAQLGEVPLNVRFRSQDLSKLVTSMNSHNNFNVVGIIGADWLHANNIVIDFSAKEIRKL